MNKRLITAAVAGFTMLAIPTAAFATESSDANALGRSDHHGGPHPYLPGVDTKPLHLRAGLTLTIPTSWKVYKGYGDEVRVVTGSCRTIGTSGFGFGDTCHAFSVMGPKRIASGNEFSPYTPNKHFYPSSDVQPCPLNKKLYWLPGGLVTKGVRQVGPGHKAYYRKWSEKCGTSGDNITRRFSQREWYLPKSKILIVDQRNTPGLSTILKNASWS